MMMRAPSPAAARRPACLRRADRRRAPPRPRPLWARGAGEAGEAEAEAEAEARATPAPRRTRKREADSTDAIATFLTRRFGIAGGLAWLGVLTFGVVSEQLKTRRENYLERTGTVDVSDAEEVALANGVRYRDLRVGGGVGNTGQPRYPERGDIVSCKVSVYLADGPGSGTDAKGTFVDDNGGKLVAFLFQRRPLRGSLTAGLESAVASMRAGGVRVVYVPAALAFAESGAAFPGGGIVPPGADVVYETQVERISIPPS